MRSDANVWHSIYPGDTLSSCGQGVDHQRVIAAEKVPASNRCPKCTWPAAKVEVSTNRQSVKQPHFDGATYEASHDHARLTGQIRRVFDCMADGHWRTLEEIGRATGDSAQSISARLRDLRKEKFGSHQVHRRRRGDPAAGLFEYRVGG